eukprot:gene11129-18749_t
MDMDFGLNIDIVREHTDMNDLQYSTGCSGASCDIYLEEFMEHPKWFCNGESVVGDSGDFMDHVLPVGDGGDFRGHVFPGVMFLIWATHWLFGATVKYHRAKKADKRLRVQELGEVGAGQLWGDGAQLKGAPPGPSSPVTVASYLGALVVCKRWRLLCVAAEEGAVMVNWVMRLTLGSVPSDPFFPLWGCDVIDTLCTLLHPHATSRASSPTHLVHSLGPEVQAGRCRAGHFWVTTG